MDLPAESIMLKYLVCDMEAISVYALAILHDQSSGGWGLLAEMAEMAEIFIFSSRGHLML